MTYLILGIAVLAGFLLAGRWYVQADPKLIIKAVKWLLISSVLLIALYFLITGRIGLALAALPALLPWFIRLRQAAILAKTIHNMSQNGQSKRNANDNRTYQGHPNNNTSQMSIAEAYDILGLDDPATEDEIREAHRRLIANVHPDKGGSTYLAAQINRAKDMLLG